MRALIQRVTQARVTNEDDLSAQPASIEKGYVILLGVGCGDSEDEVKKLWSKIIKLRIFEDDQGKTNLSLKEVEGSVLVVSQFTLYASCKKGNRPSFTDAGNPERAEALYRLFVECAREEGVYVQQGWFGAHMQISLVNDGPFTLWLDTDAL